jgi:dsDNA-binding SOS-regulon protein
VFKLLQFSEHAASIPVVLLIHNYRFTKFDISSSVLSIFESFELSQDHQVLSSMKLRSNLNSILDMCTKQHSVLDIADFIYEKSIQEVLSYNVINRKHFLLESLNVQKLPETKNPRKKKPLSADNDEKDNIRRMMESIIKKIKDTSS